VSEGAAPTAPTAPASGNGDIAPGDVLPGDVVPGEVVRGDVVRRTIRTLARPAAFTGTMREVLLGAFHVATYPLGWLSVTGPRRVVTVPPEQPSSNIDPLRTPVILVHGWVHNRSAFLVMARALRRAGFSHVHSFNYSSVTGTIEDAAATLGDVVDATLARTGADRCVLVGHSMGGIVARCYTQRFGGYDKVDTVATIGAPHRGTYTAALGFGAAVRQLQPGSGLLRSLEESARPSGVRWVSFYSDLDLLVAPAVNGKLIHPALSAINIRVRDTGHLSMLLSEDVLGSLIEFLTAPGDPAAAEEADRLRDRE
jgi:pimeloyl-ACP methyl ester carboxylesterase